MCTHAGNGLGSHSVIGQIGQPNGSRTLLSSSSRQKLCTNTNAPSVPPPSAFSKDAIRARTQASKPNGPMLHERQNRVCMRMPSPCGCIKVHRQLLSRHPPTVTGWRPRATKAAHPQPDTKGHVSTSHAFMRAQAHTRAHALPMNGRASGP